MSHRLPIAISLFTSTKGHFKCRDLYRATLTHLDRQIPLSDFGARYAHIKVSKSEDGIADEMTAYLAGLGFAVERTVADWSRGTVHQQEYLRDMRKASMNHAVQSQPFTLLLEDDSLMVSLKDDLAKVLYRMTEFLLTSPDIVTTRFLRATDLSTSPVVAQHADHFYSPHVNLQPLICRSRDWYLVNRIIEEAWGQLSQLQCEMVLRLAFNQLTRSNLAHVVWSPDYAHTPHIGVPNHADLLREFNLL